jgi:hypothetical protein
MDPITVEDIYKKRIKIALFELYRNNLSPQTTDREKCSNDFDAKYTEVLIDLGFRTLVEKIQNQGAFVTIIKSQQRRYFFMKGDFIDTLCK